MNKDISLIIAAYNEEDNIGIILDGIKRILSDDIELIVIDDGSTDNTSEEASKHGAIVYKNDKNMGKGFSVREGIKKATGRIAVFIDCDLQDLPEDIPMLIDPIEKDNADFVIGSKFIGTRRNGAISNLNYLGNKLATFFVNILFGVKLTDTQSGFKAIKLDKLQTLELTSDEYEIETEKLLKALKKGYRVIEVPVIRDKRNAGKSNFKRIRNGARVFHTIFKEKFSDILS